MSAKRVDLKLVDDGFQLPTDPTDDERKTYAYAAAIREGIRRQKLKQTEATEAMRAAQADEVARVQAASATQAAAMQRLAVRHGRWLGGAVGLLIGTVLACVGILAMQGVIWDTAAQSFREQAMTGAILRSAESEPTDRDR